MGDIRSCRFFYKAPWISGFSPSQQTNSIEPLACCPCSRRGREKRAGSGKARKGTVWGRKTENYLGTKLLSLVSTGASMSAPGGRAEAAGALLLPGAAAPQSWTPQGWQLPLSFEDYNGGY